MLSQVRESSWYIYLRCSLLDLSQQWEVLEISQFGWSLVVAVDYNGGSVQEYLLWEVGEINFSHWVIVTWVWCKYQLEWSCFQEANAHEIERRSLCCVMCHKFSSCWDNFCRTGSVWCCVYVGGYLFLFLYNYRPKFSSQSMNLFLFF